MVFHFLLHYNMAPNWFIQSITKTIQGSSQHHCLAGCEWMFWSSRGLMKHLKAAHPGYLDVHPHPLPSDPTSPVCEKPKKKPCQYQFSFTKGFSLSFDSVDLATPTDHEDNCITDSEDSRSTNPTSFSPVSPKCPYIKDLWNEDVDHNHIPTSPISSPHPESPSSPTFTIQSEMPAGHKDEKAPNQHYSRIYHPELNGM